MPGQIKIHRATAEESEVAFALVEEYNEAIGVMLRDARDGFREEYFRHGSGVWLAVAEGKLAGCIALRPLHERAHAGEVKRLYVRPLWRGLGIADALLGALEMYARGCEYGTLYLDSKDDLVPALRFYARHGYVACERYNANPQATIFMRKEINTPKAV